MTAPTAGNADKLQAGIRAVRARQMPEARRLLREVIAAEPNNETAWLWMAAALETVPERQAALERVLQINPANPSARRALNQLLAQQSVRTAESTGTPPAVPPSLSRESASSPDVVPPVAILPPAPLPSAVGGSLANLPSDRTSETTPRRQIPTALLLVLGITVIVLLAAIVLGLARAPDQPGQTAVVFAGSVTPTVSFIQIQQTHDAETVTPNSLGQPIVVAAPEGIPPAWTLPPSVTPISSSTPLATATGQTITALPTVTAILSPTTTGTPPSADALSLVFAQEVKGHPALRTLQTIHGDGNQLATLTDAATSATDPAWSPDGRQLAYVTLVNGIPQIAIAHSDGSQSQVVTHLSGAYLRSPRWSLDGKQIAFAGSLPAPDSERAGLYLLTVADSSITLLIDPLKADPQAPVYTIHDPSWSPDGTKIAYAETGLPFDVFRIAVFSLATQKSQTLTDGSYNAIQPAWSPAGNQIAFTAIRTGHAAVMTISPDGSSPQVLTVDAATSENRDPAWSPDGHWLAFSSNREGSFAVYVALNNPTGLTGLTRLSALSQPAFTPAFRPGHS